MAKAAPSHAADPHKHFIGGPAKIKELRERGFAVHSSGTVIYHEPQTGHFYVHAGGQHSPKLKVHKDKYGGRKVYLHENKIEHLHTLFGGWKPSGLKGL